MRFWLNLIPLLSLLAVPALVPFLCHADTTDAPTSVGLWNFSTVVATQNSQSTVALPRNIYRAGLIIQNNGTIAVVIKPQGAGAIKSNTDGFTLSASTFMQINPPPVDGFYVKTVTTGSASVVFIENIK